jgi:hypothetical protein
MVNIVVAGIGHGVTEGVQAYTTLENPGQLSEIREELKRAGVNIRDVLGYIPVLKGQPVVAMMNNPFTGVQEDCSVGKGIIGNITPPGGKVDGLYKTMAEAGLMSIEQAYAARGFVGEADELGGPNAFTLKFLNKAQGLPDSEVLTSPNGEDLYVNGKLVRRFEKKEGGSILQLTPMDENMNNYDPLTEVIVSYAIGLNPLDQKSGKHTATAVANIWIPISEAEFGELSDIVGSLSVDGISTLERVPMASFGNEYHTTVANMVATALLLESPEGYQRLTGEEMPESTPKPSEMAGFKGTKRVEDASIEEMVNEFRKTL